MPQFSDRNSLRSFLESVEDCGWPKKDHDDVMKVYDLQDRLGAQTNWIEQLIQVADDLNERLTAGRIENVAACTARFLGVLDCCLSECEELREKAIAFEANDHRVVGLDKLLAQSERLSAARQIINSAWPCIDKSEIQAALDDLQQGRFTEYGKVSNEHPTDSGCGRNEAAHGATRTDARRS